MPPPQEINKNPIDDHIQVQPKKRNEHDNENMFVKRLKMRRNKISSSFRQQVESDPLLRFCIPVLCGPCMLIIFLDTVVSCLFLLNNESFALH